MSGEGHGMVEYRKVTRGGCSGVVRQGHIKVVCRGRRVSAAEVASKLSVEGAAKSSIEGAVKLPVEGAVKSFIESASEVVR